MVILLLDHRGACHIRRTRMLARQYGFAALKRLQSNCGSRCLAGDGILRHIMTDVLHDRAILTTWDHTDFPCHIQDSMIEIGLVSGQNCRMLLLAKMSGLHVDATKRSVLSLLCAAWLVVGQKSCRRRAAIKRQNSRKRLCIGPCLAR